MEMRIVTNNVPREIVDAWELTPAEREEFDYLDWAKIEEGADSASFVRYKGELYNLSDFSTDYGLTKGGGLPAHLSGWQAYMSLDFSTALVIRIVGDDDQVVIGRVES